jgi:hypothetical protein
MDLMKLIKSKEYKDASARIASWKAKLAKAGPEEAMKVRDEKSEFFGKMRGSSPALYSAFQLDDKTLSEMIYKKLTGREVVID